MAEEQQDLRELLADAQTALEEGRHQEATVACRHVLRDYPDSVTAMRLLGESYLEAGRSEEAGRAFEKVLGIDPYNVLARVGLGVLAEDRGEDERAIAQFRHAWEVAPTLPQLRSELVRLYRKRYGVGGRLRMTRIALANLHAHNEDLPRAIRQFQQLFDEEPGRPDVTIGLAESLWRHGDRTEAAEHCRRLLAERPRLVRPALILAAIQGDSGDAAAATATLETVRPFDPDAVVARDLLALQSSPTLTQFVDAPVEMTPFDPATLDIAGTDELLGVQTGTLGEESFRWEDIAGGLSGESALHQDSATPVEGFAPSATDDDDVEALFAAIDRRLAASDGDEDLPDFTMPDDEELALATEEADDEPLPSWDTEPDDAMAPAPDEPTAVERLTANWDNIDNELAAARPSDDPPIGVTGMLGGVELDLKPFDVESDAEPEADDTPKFDPAKFSLPPLDGEDDDDLDLAIDDDDLGGDVIPFSLEETGPRSKTNGLTFAELVRKGEESAAPAYPSKDRFTDTLDDDVALGEVASIFATRELAALPEDRVLETQALPPEVPTPPALPSAPQPVDATALLGTLALDQPDPIADSAGAQTPVAMNGQGEDAGEKRPRSFAELFDVCSSQRQSGDNGYAVNATRPLLAPAEHATDDAAPAEESQLFDRLRQRQPERAETGELLPETDHVIPAPIAAASAETPSPDPVADAGATDVDLLESVTMDGAGLDDWLMSLAPLDNEAHGAGEIGKRAGDDWLSDYTLSAADDEPEYTPLAGMDEMFDHDALTNTRWSFSEETESRPVARDEVVPSWSERVPDEPTPVAGRLTHGDSWRDESLPSWTAELPSNGLAARESYAASAVQESAPELARPFREEPERPPITAQDRADQRAILESLIEADPTNPFARLTLAVAYSSTDPERALSEYRRLIKDSDDLLPEIVERLKEMIADGDAPSRAHRVLGDAYMKLNQFDLAMAEFQRALTSRTRARK
jgi:tetratricopeptide (TPR) repeat protein